MTSKQFNKTLPTTMASQAKQEVAFPEARLNNRGGCLRWPNRVVRTVGNVQVALDVFDTA